MCAGLRFGFCAMDGSHVFNIDGAVAESAMVMTDQCEWYAYDFPRRDGGEGDRRSSRLRERAKRINAFSAGLSALDVSLQASEDASRAHHAIGLDFHHNRTRHHRSAVVRARHHMSGGSPSLLSHVTRAQPNLLLHTACGSSG